MDDEEYAWRHHCGTLNEGKVDMRNLDVSCRGCTVQIKTSGEIEARYILIEFEGRQS